MKRDHQQQDQRSEFPDEVEHAPILEQGHGLSNDFGGRQVGVYAELSCHGTVTLAAGQKTLNLEQQCVLLEFRRSPERVNAMTQEAINRIAGTIDSRHPGAVEVSCNYRRSGQFIITSMVQIIRRAGTYLWKIRYLAGFLSVGALLNGCALLGPPQYTSLKEQRPPDLPIRVELKEVPFFAQEEFQCGPASIAMAMNAAGAKVTPEQMLDQVYVPARKGSLQIEMLVAPRRHGLVTYELAPQLIDLLREVAAGTPVIVLENYGYRWWPLWHYAVIVGYDLDASEIIRRSGTQQRQTMPFPVFEYVWLDEGYWAMVVLPPDRVPVTATEARYAQAVAALERSGHTRNAQIAYHAMLKRWPASLGGLMGLGNTAYTLKDLDAAESAFRQATQAHPKAAAPLNNLANVLAERGKLDEALAAAERAVSLGGPLLAATQATLEEIRKKAETQTQ